MNNKNGEKFFKVQKIYSFYLFIMLGKYYNYYPSLE